MYLILSDSRMKPRLNILIPLEFFGFCSRTVIQINCNPLWKTMFWGDSRKTCILLSWERNRLCFSLKIYGVIHGFFVYGFDIWKDKNIVKIQNVQDLCLSCWACPVSISGYQLVWVKMQDMSKSLSLILPLICPLSFQLSLDCLKSELVFRSLCVVASERATQL